jgi:predicted MFS family arabinose efflux permease
VAGQLADVFSKRLLVVLSLAVWSVVTAATGLATSALMLLTLRAAMGISESLYMPAAIALTANAYPPEKRSRAVSLLTTAQIAGTVGGSWFGGWMAQQGMWRTAFLCLGGIGLLYALPYASFLRSIDEESSLETKKTGTYWSLKDLVSIPTFLLLCAVFPLFVFGLWLLYSWLPQFLYEKFDLSLSQAALTATLYLQLGSFIGLLLGGMGADWLFLRTKAARLWLMTVSLVLCAPCLHFIGHASTFWGTCTAAFLFGVSSGLLMGNIFPAAFEVVPGNTRASAVGLLNFCGALLSGFAPLVGGTFKQSLGLERLLSMTGGVYFLAAILLILGIRWLFPIDYAKTH